MKSDYNGEIVGKHNVNSYAVRVNGTNRTTVRNRASLRKIPPPVPIHEPLTVQAPVKSSGPSAELAVGSQRAVPSGMVTRAGLKSSTVPRQNSTVPEQNAGTGSQADYDQTCDLIMQVAANMDTPGNILSVLRKPSRPKSGSLSAPGHKVADSGQSKAQPEHRQPASAGQGSGGSGGVLGGQDRLDIRKSTLSDKTVAQVDGPQGEPSPHQVDGAQGGPSPHLGQSVEVGLPLVRRSIRQRSQLSPYQAGSSGMEGRSDKIS